MQISAVIPTFNRAHTLERAIRSVTNQSSAVNEIILIDDGSSDGSALRMKQAFPEIKLLRQDNQGVSAARNRGIAAARCDWIALLDSDDCWHADKIEQVRHTQEEHPGFVLYHSDEIWMRNDVRVNPMQKHRKRGGRIFRHCLPLCAISPSTVVMRKDTLAELDGFDETLPACEDYDLWLRLCHRYPVHFIDKALITRYAGHEDQLSQRYPAMDRYRIRSLDRQLREAELSTGDHAATLDTLLSKLDILLKGAAKHANQAVLDEFGPMRERWRELSTGVQTC